MNYKDQCESNISNATVANTSAFQLQQQQQMLLRQMGPPTISNDSPASTTNSSLSSRRPRLRLDNLPSMTSSNTGNPMLQGAPNGQTGVLGPFTAPMPQFENQAFNPFFSNIRQNMELSHGPIRERFPIRLPSSSKNDKVDQQQKPRCVAGGRINNDDASFVAPDWLQSTIKENGAQILAETYEVSHRRTLYCIDSRLTCMKNRNWKEQNKEDFKISCIFIPSIQIILLNFHFLLLLV